MAPRTKEQFATMRSCSRKRIFEAALNLFIQKGFKNTTVTMIAQEAGISKGLVYNYFTSKQEILKAVFTEKFAEIQTTVPYIDNTEPPLDKLRLYLEGAITTIKVNLDFWKLQFQLLTHPDTRLVAQNQLKDLLDSLDKIVEDIFLELGVNDPRGERRLFNAIMDGIVMRYVLSDGVYPIDKVKEMILDKYQQQFGKPNQSGG